MNYILSMELDMPVDDHMPIALMCRWETGTAVVSLSLGTNEVFLSV
jgi:hypothetical protein